MRRALLLRGLLLSGAIATLPAATGLTSPRPTLMVVEMSFYGELANAVEPEDAASALAATSRLRSALGDTELFTLADPGRTAELLARGDRPGLPCAASVDCAREAARALGARWVVMGKVSKTSNLIWYISGQLIDAETGRMVLDDGFELKGQRDDMVPRGAVSLARRIAKAAQSEMTGG